MFRTLLVLLFLAACGVYFHHSSQSAPSPRPASSASVVQEKHVVDDEPLQALRKVLPSALFEKDVQPSIEQNRREGLTREQLAQLLARLEGMGRTLGGKASESVDKAVKDMEAVLPSKPDTAERVSGAAGSLARSVSEGMKESLPALQEMSADLLKGMVTVLSQMLNAAAELLKK